MVRKIWRELDDGGGVVVFQARGIDSDSPDQSGPYLHTARKGLALVSRSNSNSAMTISQ